MCREMRLSEEDIQKRITEQFKLSGDEARRDIRQTRGAHDVN